MERNFRCQWRNWNPLVKILAAHNSGHLESFWHSGSLCYQSLLYFANKNLPSDILMLLKRNEAQNVIMLHENDWQRQPEVTRDRILSYSYMPQSFWVTKINLTESPMWFFFFLIVLKPTLKQLHKHQHIRR